MQCNANRRYIIIMAATMYACAQNNDGVHDFPSPRATTRPPRRISTPIPPDSRRKIGFLLKFSAFRAILPKKLRTVRPKMRRNSKAKAAAMPTHIQNDSHTHNFPHLRIPPSRSQLQRKSNRSRAHLHAERQPYPQFPIPLCCHPAAHGAFPPHSRPIPAENSGFC